MHLMNAPVGGRQPLYCAGGNAVWLPMAHPLVFTPARHGEARRLARPAVPRNAWFWPG